MLCEECGKNPAEVLMTTVVNGESASRHLCRECFRKYKAGDIQSVLAAVLSAMSHKGREKEEKKDDLICLKCGETFAEFQKTGRLGCAACYEAFKSELTPLITRVQGRAQHAGRRPPSCREDEERLHRMAEMRTLLDEAVAREDYEQAAKLRDEIKALAAAPAKEDAQ